MWRVVLDGVTLTSALLNAHGPAARLLDAALQGRMRLFITLRMLAAQHEALRDAALSRRHGLTDHDLSSLMADIAVLFCLAPDSTQVVSDGRLVSETIACAMHSRADFLVTSAPLNTEAVEQQGTHVVTAQQLVELLDRDLY